MAADNRRSADYVRQFGLKLETEGMKLTPEQRQGALTNLLRMEQDLKTQDIKAPAAEAIPTSYLMAGAGLLVLLVGGVVVYKRRQKSGGLGCGCGLGDPHGLEEEFTRALNDEWDPTPDMLRARRLAAKDHHIAAAFYQAAEATTRRTPAQIAASLRAMGDRWAKGTR